MHAQSPGKSQRRVLMVLGLEAKDSVIVPGATRTLLSLRKTGPLPAKSSPPQWKSGHGL